MMTFKQAISDLRGDYRQNTHYEISWCKFVLRALVGISPLWSLLLWFRLAKVDNPIAAWPARIIFKFFCGHYNLAISWRTDIGEGLYLGHGICMVINHMTKIGKNCNISQFVNIGTNHDTPAVIGDNVYIGPMVCIVEDVRIGNNVTIGAGAVVTKDIPDNATVAGVPAKILNFENPGRYIFKQEYF